jgi:hypothetical protein
MAVKPMVQFIHKGDFKHIEAFFAKTLHLKPAIRIILNKYGQMGVDALKEATPKDTGKTSESWSYKVTEDSNGNMKIEWHNSNLGNGWAPIAILLQYGHATRNGGYVQGQDYINPAIDQIFHRMADDAWKEVNHERNR